MLHFLKNITLFFAAPFIALAYLIALPFVGLYMFINLGVERGLKDLSETPTIQSEHTSLPH